MKFVLVVFVLLFFSACSQKNFNRDVYNNLRINECKKEKDPNLNCFKDYSNDYNQYEKWKIKK